jgi:hypothetical protein
MRRVRHQFSLKAVLGAMAVVAYVAALCSNVRRLSLAGVVATLAVHSAAWFAIWSYRLRRWQEPFDTDAT